MFEATPRFEELPIRVEVERYGQTQPIKVHVERWDASSRMVLRCYAPDGGQWLIVKADSAPYFVGKPHRLVCYRLACDIRTRERVLVPALKKHRVERLQNLVREAFKSKNFRALHVVTLHELPHEPRRACQLGSDDNWYWEWERSQTPFRPQFVRCGLCEEQTRQLLLNEWNDEASDTRFAWEWPQWNDEEHKLLCCGLECDFKELERVMLWVLTCSQQLWSVGSGWEWVIHPTFPSRGYVTNHSGAGRPLVSSLGAWQECLFGHFAPDWRTDWLAQHECVKQFWQRTSAFQRVRIEEPPNFHEQMEASLNLRAWLERNAPERMDLLITS